MNRRPVEDELKVRRAAEREGRRARRRRARENENFSKHYEGMSSDDEIPDQDNITYKQNRDAIITDRDEIFSDVIDDYSNIKNILEHLENWRRFDYDSYTEAYASLCIPKIVGPFLRLELIFWNPLIEQDDNIEKQKWFQSLMIFGLENDENEEKLSQDNDVLLIPNIIEKIILPKLNLTVEKCWDCLSSSQNLRLIGLISRYIRKYPSLAPDSKNLTSLFNLIIDKFKNSVEHDIFIPIFTRQNSFDTKNPFFQRQFNSALKLLKNISSWQGLISDKILKELALASILNRYLLSAINVCQVIDAVSKAALISHSLPRIWLQGDTKELVPFSNCVSKLGNQLDKDNPLHL